MLKKTLAVLAPIAVIAALFAIPTTAPAVVITKCPVGAPTASYWYVVTRPSRPRP